MLVATGIYTADINHQTFYVIVHCIQNSQFSNTLFALFLHESAKVTHKLYCINQFDTINQYTTWRQVDMRCQPGILRCRSKGKVDKHCRSSSIITIIHFRNL